MMNQLILEINSILEVYFKLKIQYNVQKSILKFMGEIIAYGALQSREDYEDLRPTLKKFNPSFIQQIDLKLQEPGEVIKIKEDTATTFVEESKNAKIMQ